MSFVIIVIILSSYSCIITGEEDISNDNPFSTLLETPENPQSSSSSPSSSPSSIDSFSVFPVLTRVINVFPPSGKNGSHVSVILDEDKIDGVSYGSAIEKLTMMHSVEDFVIDFHAKGGSSAHKGKKPILNDNSLLNDRMIYVHYILGKIYICCLPFAIFLISFYSIHVHCKLIIVIDGIFCNSDIHVLFYMLFMCYSFDKVWN